MQLIYDQHNGLHSVTLEINGRPCKGFFSADPIKCINKGREWLRRAQIALKINLN